MWIRQLGPEIANLYGAGRMMIIYTRRRHRRLHAQQRCWACCRIAVLRRAALTVGASASIFGLLGALVHYGRRTGSSHIRQVGLQYALFMGIMGFIFPASTTPRTLAGSSAAI